jgi:hypothetical protein
MTGRGGRLLDGLTVVWSKRGDADRPTTLAFERV